MAVPEWIKPAAWGAVAGAGVFAIVVFSAGWVVMSGSAEKMASTRVNNAIVATMTPICVAQFKAARKAEAMSQPAKNTPAPSETIMAAFMKVDTWKRDEFVRKHGWATMPGSETPNPGVASACAQELTKLAAAAAKK